MGRIWMEEAIAGKEKKSFSCLHDRVRETILAIDAELSIAMDEEYRRVLVKTGYALRDLSLRVQRQEALKISPPKTRPTVY